MTASTNRLGARTKAAWAIVLWLVVGVAAPAAATPVTLFFDGPSGYGVSAASAEASGVPFLYPDIESANGILSVISQELLLGTADPFPPGDTDNHVTSMWTVQNESSDDLLANVYFLFLTSVPHEIGGQSVEYDDENVGFTIDPADGWVLVRTQTNPGEGYYYPAISLGSLEAGAAAAPFAVHYVVNEPIEQVITTWVLPQIAAGMGIVPIPEPSAGVLMGFGLALLAIGRRRS